MMRRITRIVALVSFIVVSCACATTAASFMFSLTGVTLYCQEGVDQCGAASAQMAHDGYPGSTWNPSSPGPVFFPQSALWTCLQANKQDPGVAWSTDPDGLSYCLNDMSHAPLGSWIVLNDTTYETEMYQILYWMTTLGYPTPALVYENHWLVISGFWTDVNPSTGPNPDLEYIELQDPMPFCPTGYANQQGVKKPGTYRFVSDTKWHDDYFLNLTSTTPIDYSPSTWYGDYLAVLEPPVYAGRVQPEVPMVRFGDPIGPGRALASAQDAVQNLEFCQHDRLWPFCEMFPFEETVGLVNHGYRGVLWPERAYGGYYVIPYGYERGAAEGAILVNAYTGEFEEACLFDPTPVLRMDNALEIASMEIDTANARADLVFEYSAQTQSDAFPLWRVTVRDGTVVYVDRFGVTYFELTPQPPGD